MKILPGARTPAMTTDRRDQGARKRTVLARRANRLQIILAAQPLPRNGSRPEHSIGADAEALRHRMVRTTSREQRHDHMNLIGCRGHQLVVGGVALGGGLENAFSEAFAAGVACSIGTLLMTPSSTCFMRLMRRGSNCGMASLPAAFRPTQE